MSAETSEERLPAPVSSVPVMLSDRRIMESGLLVSRSSRAFKASSDSCAIIRGLELGRFLRLDSKGKQGSRFGVLESACGGCSKLRV